VVKEFGQEDINQKYLLEAKKISGILTSIFSLAKKHIFGIGVTRN